MNKTESALMARGVDRAKALRLRRAGWTVGGLRAESDARLRELGLLKREIGSLRSGSRTAIPLDVLVAVCMANKWTCCVCRDESRSIVVHHIEPWASSQDHSPKNLAVVCLLHHGEAHTKRELGITLTKQKLRKAKQLWEQRVREDDQDALRYLPAFENISWYYFNHQRLFEVAREAGIDFAELDGYREALAAEVISANGEMLRPRRVDSYMYEGQHIQTRYRYTSAVMDSLWGRLHVIDVSDHLDRSEMRNLLYTGYVYVQGAHNFSLQGRVRANGEAVTKGTRSANRVSITYVFDRSEATSCSAWSMWLRGHQVAGSLVRIRSCDTVDGRLVITGTVIGICAPIDGLQKRRYDLRLWESGVAHRLEADFDEDE